MSRMCGFITKIHPWRMKLPWHAKNPDREIENKQLHTKNKHKVLERRNTIKAFFPGNLGIFSRAYTEKKCPLSQFLPCLCDATLSACQCCNMTRPSSVSHLACHICHSKLRSNFLVLILSNWPPSPVSLLLFLSIPLSLFGPKQGKLLIPVRDCCKIAEHVCSVWCHTVSFLQFFFPPRFWNSVNSTRASCL